MPGQRRYNKHGNQRSCLNLRIEIYELSSLLCVVYYTDRRLLLLMTNVRVDVNIIYLLYLILYCDKPFSECIQYTIVRIDKIYIITFVKNRFAQKRLSLGLAYRRRYLRNQIFVIHRV